MTLNNVNLYLSARLKQKNSSNEDVIDYKVELLTKFGGYKIEPGFTELFFYEFPNGKISGNDATVSSGFYFVFKNTDDVIVTTTSAVDVDKYETERTFEYKITVSKSISSTLLTSDEYIKTVELWYTGDDGNGNAKDVKLITSNELGLSTLATADTNGNSGIKLTAGYSTELSGEYTISIEK